MARTSTAARTGYRCEACGHALPRWAGRCPDCQAWGTVGERQAEHPQSRLRAAVTGVSPARPARPVADVTSVQVARRQTGLAEFDRVLGGGLVPGQVVLLAGEPGVGKSTLLIDAAHRHALGGGGRTVLYVSGEESAEQIGVRARRLGLHARGLLVADETDLQVLLGHVEQTDPDLLVVDSVQTVAAAAVDGRAGGIAQVHEVTQALTRVAKARGMPLLLIGQSTRDNVVAGPRALEHLVDTVLTFEGDRHTPLRLLRAVKNRFGPADEVVCFVQADDGLHEVADPSQLFRAQRDRPVAGTCLTVTIEGRRALLAEVQALVTATPAPNPRRGVTGMDPTRAAMLVAVAQRHGRLPLHDHDVWLASVAGVRITDPAADLATCLAVASATWDLALPADLVAIGEVALSGDVRPVPAPAQRLAEAARLGFRRVLAPPGTLAGPGRGQPLTEFVEVGRLADALDLLRSAARQAEPLAAGQGPRDAGHPPPARR